MDNKGWKNLQKGDTLYLLTPTKIENGNVLYTMQKTYVISISPTKENGWQILRMKFTDRSGLRRRVEVTIGDNTDKWTVFGRLDGFNSFSKPYNYWLSKSFDYGDFIATYDNEAVNEIYDKLIASKKAQISSLIKQQEDYLKELAQHKLIQEITDAIFNENEIGIYRNESKKMSDIIYVAWGNPHDCYGRTCLGFYDTREEAEESLRNFSYGGEIEETTYGEFNSVRF